MSADKKEENFEAIFKLVSHLKKTQKQALEHWVPIVEGLIQSNSKNQKEIERTLDYLLDVSSDENGLPIYRKLCRHLYEIDPNAAIYYVNSWKEMWDEEGQLFGN